MRRVKANRDRDLSLALAGGAVLIFLFAQVFSSASGAGSSTIDSAPRTARVLVPRGRVLAGTRIGDIEFIENVLPLSEVPPAALLDLGPYQDAVLVRVLPANAPVLRGDVRFGAAQNPVEERILPGMRALSVRVDETVAVEGWAGSGALVDVLLVTSDATQVIAERVKILSAERSLEPVSDDEEPTVPGTVTLLVSQIDALKISQAILTGKITFVLRGTDDNGFWQARRLERGELSGERRDESKEQVVNGYAVYHDKDGKKRRLVLSKGAWLRSTVRPAGFFAGVVDE